MVKFHNFCHTCVTSGFLCNSCQKKLDQGQITEFELDLAKDLIELEESDGRFDYLRDVSFYQAIDFEDVVILMIGKGDKIRITEELISWIKETYEIQKILLIEKTDKPRPIIEGLITPYKLLSLNEIFLATGDIEFRAVIRESEMEKALFTKEELEDLVYELTGKMIRVELQ
jgi:transcription antitermination factor NusA-like protein